MTHNINIILLIYIYMFNALMFLFDLARDSTNLWSQKSLIYNEHTLVEKYRKINEEDTFIHIRLLP